MSRQGHPGRIVGIEKRPLEPDPVDTGVGSAAEQRVGPAPECRVPYLRRPRRWVAFSLYAPPPSVAVCLCQQIDSHPSPLRIITRTEWKMTDYPGAFPNSKKVYIDGPHGIRVPMREISLSGGEPPLRVYDTSGPLGHEVREGLPALREEWIRGRGDVEVVRTADEERSRFAETVDLTTNRSAVSRDHAEIDRKSTRLNSSHVAISYAVFCLK